MNRVVKWQFSVFDYAAKAKELDSSPVAVAVKNWTTKPVVTAIYLSNYNKHVGDAILVAVQDDFEVTGMMVSIEDNAHAAVESGKVFDAASGSWEYTATVDASSKSDLTATASDRPGNTGTLTGTK